MAGDATPLMVSAEFALAHTIDPIISVQQVVIPATRILTREGLPAAFSGDKYRSMVVESYYAEDGELLFRKEIEEADDDV